jgi:hypothetical protein
VEHSADGGEVSKAQQIADSFAGALGHADGGPILDPAKVQQFQQGFFGSNKKAKGGSIKDFRKGGHVPGQPAHPGDDPRNDTVPAMVSPGEVVLPNTVTKSPDAPNRAKEFMKAIKEEKEPGPKGYAKILDVKNKMKELQAQMDEMHKMLKKVK